jgi:hypothetical protein
MIMAHLVSKKRTEDEYPALLQEVDHRSKATSRAMQVLAENSLSDQQHPDKKSFVIIEVFLEVMNDNGRRSFHLPAVLCVLFYFSVFRYCE